MGFTLCPDVMGLLPGREALCLAERLAAPLRARASEQDADGGRC